MNDELVKELNEAGYPLQYSAARHALQKKIGTEWEDSKDAGLIAPTLSELIEACGEGFHELHRHEKHFSAHHYPADMELQFYTYGESAEISVARLWLALNKKKI